SCFFQGFGTIGNRRAGGENIIDQQNGLAFDQARPFYFERVLNAFLSRLSVHSRPVSFSVNFTGEAQVVRGYAGMGAQTFGNDRCLVKSAFFFAARGQRHGNDPCNLVKRRGEKCLVQKLCKTRGDERPFFQMQDRGIERAFVNADRTSQIEAVFIAPVAKRLRIGTSFFRKKRAAFMTESFGAIEDPGFLPASMASDTITASFHTAATETARLRVQ